MATLCAEADLSEALSNDDADDDKEEPIEEERECGAAPQ